MQERKCVMCGLIQYSADSCGTGECIGCKEEIPPPQREEEKDEQEPGKSQGLDKG